MDFEQVIETLEAQVKRCEAGEAPEQAALTRAVRRSLALAPSLTPEQQRALQGAMAALTEATEALHEKLGVKLGELGMGRKAVHGYGSLRAHKEGQRLNIKA